MRITAYLPTKRNAYWILAVLIISIGLLVVYPRKKIPNYSYSKNLSGILSQQAGGADDIDGDGLKDWEEVLWKTDPNSPDSDNDGTSDGEEVALGRDPLKPGPDDIFNNPLASNVFVNKYDTETEGLSRRLFAEYLTLKKDGSLDDETKTQIIERFINDLPGQDGAKDPFTLADLKISKDNSASAYRRYGNILGLLVAEMTKPVNEEELEIFSRAVETNNNEILKKLDPAKETFRGIASTISLMEVPSGLAENHLTLLNSLVGAYYSLSAMQEVNNDPALALGGLNAYQYEVEVITGSFKVISQAVKNKGVVYSPKEAGALIFELGSV